MSLTRYCNKGDKNQEVGQGDCNYLRSFYLLILVKGNDSLHLVIVIYSAYKDLDNDRISLLTT